MRRALPGQQRLQTRRNPRRAVSRAPASDSTAGEGGGQPFRTVAGAVLVVWTWWVIGQMNAEQTAAYATREDPARALTDLVVLIARVASLAGVVYLLAAGSGGHGAGEAIAAGLGIASVAGAWAVMHTVFTLRYALLYNTDELGGIDFDQSERPAYVDFAYLAFTLGMTYQVSDTDLQTRPIRATAFAACAAVLPAGRGRAGDRHQTGRRTGQKRRRLSDSAQDRNVGEGVTDATDGYSWPAWRP
jgi:hypothetical protein